MTIEDCEILCECECYCEDECELEDCIRICKEEEEMCCGDGCDCGK
jgi:hypothetical protein